MAHRYPILYCTLTNTRPNTLYFLPFFFLEPPEGVAEGVLVSTKTGSSSLATFALSVSSSNSFMNSFLMVVRRFSHHSFSCSVCAWISSSRSRSVVLAAISFADWKMIWPQFGARALA